MISAFTVQLEWTKTDLTLTDDGNPIVTYNVYKKDVKNGEEIKLGAINRQDTAIILRRSFMKKRIFQSWRHLYACSRQFSL
jgi:hypothetical protein